MWKVTRSALRTPQELDAQIERLLAPPAHERVEPIMVIQKDGRWHACGQHFPRRSVSAESLPQLRVELWDALLDEPWSVFPHKTSLALVKAATPMAPPRAPRCIIADWDPRTATWAVGRPGHRRHRLRHGGPRDACSRTSRDPAA